MLSIIVKDPATLSILQALAIFIFGAAGILLGKYCKEKGYSFWLCFFLCVLLQLAGILIVFLLPDIARMQAETEARQRYRDEEIAALKKRIAQLKQAQGTAAAPGTAGAAPEAGPCSAVSSARHACPLSGPDPGDHLMPPLRQAAAGESGPVLFLQAPLCLRR